MSEGWTITESGFEPTRLHQRETVFTIGNGYLCTRGAFEEGYPGAWPATLIHGVFDDVPIAYTELANGPDWLPLSVLVAGERFAMDRGKLLRYQRELHLRNGLLTREVRWISPAGHALDLRFERFASLADPHVLVVRCVVTSLDVDVLVEGQAAIDGYPDNRGVMHWEWLGQGDEGDTVWLNTRTRQSGIELGMAARLTVDSPASSGVEVWRCQGRPTLVTRLSMKAGQTATLEKTVTVFTSREVDAPAPEARARLVGLPASDALLEDHTAAWAKVWQASDVTIEGDPRAQEAVRYNLFQVIIAAPREDDRVSIGARTLSGFGYRGHVFWDTELFILPFFIYTQPDLARNMLTFRYRTLPGARRKARSAGYGGAMFAWESAVTGDEVTPRWVLGPTGEELVRIWTGDIQLHISADVAFAAWRYWQVTGDDDWMERYGAEIILDTAVFWGERVEESVEGGRYELRDVIGPDEYHEHVDNNAFTNRMVQWHLETALEVLAWLQRHNSEWAALLTDRLGLNEERTRRWKDIIGGLRVLQDPDSGLIEQFEGFFNLAEVPWDKYESRTGSMQALLGIEGANRSQVLKQPDVLMLLYLLRDRYDRETLRANWDYYAPRTDHAYGSSLGPAIHALLACELGELELAYEHFIRSALADLEDVRGNAADGIHAASAGAVWQAVVFGFGGVRLTESGPVAAPRLPAGWARLRFRLCYGGDWYDFDLRKQRAPTDERQKTKAVLGRGEGRPRVGQ